MDGIGPNGLLNQLTKNVTRFSRAFDTMDTAMPANMIRPTRAARGLDSPSASVGRYAIDLICAEDAANRTRSGDVPRT